MMSRIIPNYSSLTLPVEDCDVPQVFRLAILYEIYQHRVRGCDLAFEQQLIVAARSEKGFVSLSAQCLFLCLLNKCVLLT